MVPFNRHSYDVESQEIGSFGKLPRLSQEDDTGNKSEATNRLCIPTANDQMQELANIESQYSELIKPHTNPKRTKTTSHDVVRNEPSRNSPTKSLKVRVSFWIGVTRHLLIQETPFKGVQALVDAVVGATKVHIIDLSIKQGW
ncbi:unnamed protein product [Lactuca saligna]|uniref:Uncharacterized protein n=1 Tax=Lactuca saligna TaxID=75948 RepID=A0AA35ZB49_LACSI|nr:unnamed protein product [Lactuca saligna]